MRFLMLNWRDPNNPLAGGAERVSEKYMRGLMERGHEVAWFANAFDGAVAEEDLDAANAELEEVRLGFLERCEEGLLVTGIDVPSSTLAACAFDRQLKGEGAIGNEEDPALGAEGFDGLLGKDLCGLAHAVE